MRCLGVVRNSCAACRSWCTGNAAITLCKQNNTTIGRSLLQTALIQQIRINMLEDICEHVNPSVMVCGQKWCAACADGVLEMLLQPNMQNNLNWHKVADS
jgi:hypothetical protein